MHSIFIRRIKYSKHALAGSSRQKQSLATYGVQMLILAACVNPGELHDDVGRFETTAFSGSIEVGGAQHIHTHTQTLCLTHAHIARALASTPTYYPRAGRDVDGRARRVRGALLVVLGQQVWLFRYFPSSSPRYSESRLMIYL
jgi:hypothetical protein